MLHALRVDLLDMPKVVDVVRAVELVTCTLLPAIEADLERAHEVLAGQDRMLLVPHDAL
jgi:hypothetical protein